MMTLERKGVLYRDPHRPRAYRVRTAWSADFPEAPTQVPSDLATHVPLVGRIAAGAPIVAEEAVEDVLTLPRSLVGEGQLFALKVVGDSMVDAAICDGDIVTVRRQDSADQGDIVASLGENCGAKRPSEDQCSSVAVQRMLAPATRVVLSLDRANERRRHVARCAV